MGKKFIWKDYKFKLEIETSLFLWEGFQLLPEPAIQGLVDWNS